MDDSKEKLLIDFHNQFSENHNHQQGIFVQILAAVMVLFSAYGYVLVNTLNQENNSYDGRILPIITIVSIVVLSFLSFVLISQGWSFRNAQKIVQRIRMKIVKDEYEDYFKGYGEKTDDMPGFYNINLQMLEIIKILAVLITVVIHHFFCNFVIMAIIILIASFIFEYLYYKKCKDKVNADRENGLWVYFTKDDLKKWGIFKEEIEKVRKTN